jgi:lysozyme family protein
MNRDDAIALMLRVEGGEVNAAGDPGGHTKYGITQRTLDAVRGLAFPIVLPANVADLLPGEAAYIYRTCNGFTFAATTSTRRWRV